MRRPPPLNTWLRYPLTSGVALLAILVTLAGDLRYVDTAPLSMTFEAWEGQPWRLVSAALPHVGLLHLAFNVYWLWVFGTLVESELGFWRAAVLLVLFDVGSSTAEHALFHGGVGLSGVGYGLFGLLWVLSSRDERFAGAVDPPTIRLFVVWFFACIVLTWTDALRVANVAHGVGLALGLLVGVAVTAHGGRRLAWSALLVLLLVLSGAGSAFLRPHVNLAPDGGVDLAQAGYDALVAKNNERGAELYRRAVAISPRQAGWWFNLGIAYQRLGQPDRAIDAYAQAVKLAPADKQYGAALAALKAGPR